MNKYNPDIHHRHSIRLRGYDYSQEGLYFITICAPNRKHLFGEIVDDEMQMNEYGKTVEKCWFEIPQHYPKAVLHEHIVMPNHFHAILEIVGAEYFPPNNNAPNEIKVENIRPLPSAVQCKSGTLGAIIRGFKIGVTKRIGFSVWQRNYHEHIIRSAKSYQTISEYIINNPAKWNEDMFNPLNTQKV